MEYTTDKSVHPILEFVVSHVLSVCCCKNAGLTLARKRGMGSEETGASIPAVLYDKGLLTRYGLTASPRSARPCLMTTGYSIQLLSMLSSYLNSLPEGFFQTDDSPSSIRLARLTAKMPNEMKAAAGLQLLYCMDSLKAKSQPSLAEKTAAALGGMHYKIAFFDDKDADSWFPALHKGLNRMLENLRNHCPAETASTQELVVLIRTLSCQNRMLGVSDRDEQLAAVVLEILSRRTRSGLFTNDGTLRTPLAMGSQFDVMAALLRAYPFVQLDAVLEEVFALFNTLYKTAYRDAIGYFTLAGRKTLHYNAAELGAVISCLKALHYWSPDASDQQELLEGLLDTYSLFLTEAFCRHHDGAIEQLYNRWALPSWEHTGQSDFVGSKGSGPIFPKRLRLTIPGPLLTWNRPGILRLSQPLTLCLSLMELLTGDRAVKSHPGQPAAMDDGADLLLNLLLGLLGN